MARGAGGAVSWATWSLGSNFARPTELELETAEDFLALARFLQFPDDDLSLAGLLKSPLCGLTEDSLFELAHGRPSSLWSALDERAGQRADWRAARDFLARATRS